MGRSADVFVVGATMLVLAGCAGSSSGTALTKTAPTPNATPSPKALAFRLYTHCGIDEARIGSSYYEAVHPMVESGNPPMGWGDPYQQGTMTLSPPNEAIFTDQTGHRVVFRLRPHATAFKHICS